MASNMTVEDVLWRIFVYPDDGDFGKETKDVLDTSDGNTNVVDVREVQVSVDTVY